MYIDWWNHHVAKVSFQIDGIIYFLNVNLQNYVLLYTAMGEWWCGVNWVSQLVFWIKFQQHWVLIPMTWIFHSRVNQFVNFKFKWRIKLMELESIINVQNVIRVTASSAVDSEVQWSHTPFKLDHPIHASWLKLPADEYLHNVK